MNNALRWVWFLAVGWWLGPILFVCGLALLPTIVLAPLGYKMMDSAYGWATLNFD